MMVVVEMLMVYSILNNDTSKFSARILGGHMFGHDDDNKDSSVDSSQAGSISGLGTPPGINIDEIVKDLNSDSPSEPTTDDSSSTVDTPAPVSAPAIDVTDQKTNDLIDIKSESLKQLAPLVGHLDQTPEEKFRTTMMMIQASDNQDLIKDAYAAAQQITDEKAKAQALLDVVNEINYFTQHA
jgi:hypothetical protein